MIITKPIIKRIVDKVTIISKDTNVSTEKLVREIKSYLLKAVAAKGIPVNLAEEVAARLIVLVAIVDPVTVSKS